MLQIVDFLRRVRGRNRTMDFRELVMLASCDTYLQNLLFRDLSVLWEHIDLGHCRECESWTDKMLHFFLERVNAQAVTKTLLLQGVSVKGLGLIPLMNSRILETIDLRVKREIDDGLDVTVSSKVLRSMLPFNLQKVEINRGRSPLYQDFALGSVLTQLVLKETNKLTSQGSQCSSCHCILVEQLRDIVHATNVPPHQLRCFDCNKLTCRPWTSSNKCASLRSCWRCDERVCSDCGDKCAMCQRHTCTSCESPPSCALCHDKVCDRHIFFCNGCSTTCCEACLESPENKWTGCDCCDNLFCESCEEQIKTCSDSHCDTKICADCQQADACGTCSGCNKLFCINGWSDCISWPCSLCEKRFCEACEQSDAKNTNVLHCETCEEQFCGACRDVCECSSCKWWECDDCYSSWTSCSSCEKKFCQGCNEHSTIVSCGICETSVCSDCSRFCLKCLDTPFCSDCGCCCGDCGGWVCRTDMRSHQCTPNGCAKRQKSMREYFSVA